jgi:hypothetical protein
LADAHIVVLALGTRSIWMAHPFSEVPTSYTVQSGGISLLGELRVGCARDRGDVAAGDGMLRLVSRL